MMQPDSRRDDRIHSVNIRDEVYLVLRERILSHEYPPGFRFDLSKLETQLGISRTPLKEALHRLEVEGLIEIRPRRGTYVININPKDVAESFDVRRILECAAAKIVVREATDEEIAHLRAITNAMTDLLGSGDYQTVVNDYIELDRQFHKYLVGLTRNERLMGFCDQLDTHLQIARLREKFELSDSQQTEAEHEAILAALDQRDEAAVVRAIEAHIKISKTRTLKVIENHA